MAKPRSFPYGDSSPAVTVAWFEPPGKVVQYTPAACWSPDGWAVLAMAVADEPRVRTMAATTAVTTARGCAHAARARARVATMVSAPIGVDVSRSLPRYEGVGPLP